MVKFQTIKQKARLILNSDDALKSLDKIYEVPTADVPITFDASVGVIVDTLKNDIYVNDHQFALADEVVYTHTGTVIGNLTINTKYYIINKSPDIIQLALTPDDAADSKPIDLTSVGSGEQTLTLTQDFLISQITSANSIRINAHTFDTGDAVVYTTTGAELDLLENNQTYYVIHNGTNTIKLALTYDDAVVNNKVIAIVSAPDVAGTTHSIKKIVKFNANGSVVVDTSREQLNIPAHNLETGDKIQYKADIYVAIGGLNDNHFYFILRVDDDSIKLADSYQNAVKVPPVLINISGAGTGNNHSIQRVSKHFPICTNYKFRLENLPNNLNDKCRMAVVSFDYLSNNALNTKSIGGIYIKNISHADTFTSQGYYNGCLLLTTYLGNNVSYQNADIEQNSIPLPHNINNILQNGLDIFIDSKNKDSKDIDIKGNTLDNSFNISLLIYELEDFEYITNEMKNGLQHYIPPKEYL
jgi:hypothetical protein